MVMFIRVGNVSINPEMIAYIVDRSSKKKHISVGVAVTTGNEYKGEGGFNAQEFDFRGENAEKFLEWQDRCTFEIIPFEPHDYGDDDGEETDPKEWPDPFLPEN